MKISGPLASNQSNYTDQSLLNEFIKFVLIQIKVVDPSRKTCETFCGTGKPGSRNEGEDVQFDEPGGLCVSPDGRHLYVADTNNNCIRLIDLNTKSVSLVRLS